MLMFMLVLMLMSPCEPALRARFVRSALFHLFRDHVTLLSHDYSTILVHHWITHSMNFAGTHLHTWIDKNTVREECLSQEHNTISPVKASNTDRSLRGASAVWPAPLRTLENKKKTLITSLTVYSILRSLS